MRSLFGTDGIRGKANSHPVTPEIALQVGKAIAHVLGAKGHGSMRAVIGKDTRLSGYMLEAAMTSGLVSMGMDVLEIGPMPTPAISHLTKSMGAACGVMITASHNPSEDNGIKLFNADGFKLSDELEENIERHVLGGEINSEHIHSRNIGKAYRIEDARGRYIEFAKSSIKNRSIEGVKIVIDCANGAGYRIAPLIFKELGAEVVEIGVKPDGHNINLDCGATDTRRMAAAVVENGADVGISLDGDADRVIFSDASGEIVNGDRIMGMLALDLKARGQLRGDTLVVTTMSNLGLVKAMEEAGVKIDVTQVGDRHVIERMRRDDHNLGGEQSGHVVFMDYATTGDGIITALHVLKLMMDQARPLADLAAFMTEYPQRVDSVAVKGKPPVESVPGLTEVIDRCSRDLGDKGRAVVRYSGTENKIRILVEANELSSVNRWMTDIRAVVEKELCQ